MIDPASLDTTKQWRRKPHWIVNRGHKFPKRNHVGRPHKMRPPAMMGFSHDDETTFLAPAPKSIKETVIHNTGVRSVPFWLSFRCPKPRRRISRLASINAFLKVARETLTPLNDLVGWDGKVLSVGVSKMWLEALDNAEAVRSLYDSGLGFPRF
jgi:hypothetical protein